MTELTKFYAEMLLLRQFDQLCLDLKKKDLIYSGYHPYEGQEAVAVGFCAALRRDDALPFNPSSALSCSGEGLYAGIGPD